MSPPSPDPTTQNALPETAARSRVGRTSPVLRALATRELSVVLVLLFLCTGIGFTRARGAFFSPPNIHNIALQVALLSIFAIGETLVIITAGIDLSLGSMIGFIGILMAALVTHLSHSMATGMAVGLGVSVALLMALAIGAIHATLIHRLRLPAFVVTLASLLLLRSQALLVNHQLPISLADYKFLYYLANGNLFEGTSFAVPIPLLIMLVIAAVSGVALIKLRVGRYLYSVGSNEQATRLSGVNVYKVKLFAYGASALLAGIAGVLYAGYGSQGDPQAGNAYELDAVAASVVGGANLMGGEGSVIGTVLGALLLQTIFSAINLTLSSPDLWRGTVVGGVLLFAVLVTAFQRRRAE